VPPLRCVPWRRPLTDERRNEGHADILNVWVAETVFGEDELMHGNTAQAKLAHDSVPPYTPPTRRTQCRGEARCRTKPDLPVIGGGQLRHLCRNLLRGARGIGIDGGVNFPKDTDTRTDHRGRRGRARGSSTPCDEECSAREA